MKFILRLLGFIPVSEIDDLVESMIQENENKKNEELQKKKDESEYRIEIASIQLKEKERLQAIQAAAAAGESLPAGDTDAAMPTGRLLREAEEAAAQGRADDPAPPGP